MLSSMRFRCPVEIAACGMLSNFSSAGRKQTESQSARTWLRKGRLKEGQRKWRTLRVEWGFCSFVWLCYENSKLIATAAGRKSFSSTSKRESVTTQDIILSVQVKVKVQAAAFEWPGVNIQSFERQARGEHRVASSCSVQPANPTHSVA